jgi:hypothetical protein
LLKFRGETATLNGQIRFRTSLNVKMTLTNDIHTQIASRFEQRELPVWTESQELRRFIAGYLALLPIKRSSAAIDKRFVEYLLELSEGVTGRIIDVLRRAALQGIADKTQKVGLVQLQVVGAKMPSVVGQRA